VRRAFFVSRSSCSGEELDLAGQRVLLLREEPGTDLVLVVELQEPAAALGQLLQPPLPAAMAQVPVDAAPRASIKCRRMAFWIAPRKGSRRRPAKRRGEHGIAIAEPATLELEEEPHAQSGLDPIPPASF